MRVFLFIAVILGSVFWGMTNFVWPNTLLDQTDIAFWPKILVKKYLNNKSTELIEFTDGEQTKWLSRKDLGLEIEIEKTIKKTNPESLQELYALWTKSLSTITFIQPVFTIDENFEKTLLDKFSQGEPVVEKYYYDKKQGRFVYSTNNKDFSIDTANILAQLTSIDKINNKKIVIERIEIKSDLEKELEKYNKRLSLIYSKPLELYTEENKENVYIPREDIINLLEIDKLENLNENNIKISKAAVKELIEKYQLNNFSQYFIKQRISEAVISRFMEKESTPVVLGTDIGPNSNGEVASKYIEVDISQQKLYFFENEEVYKSYSVSTGLYYPTPTGNYKIINKSPLGFSGIFNVWMPYWMAFNYNRELGAYLGIHELPYMLNGNTKIYRFGNYIGSKKTGGCVALSPGDSKEVYEKSFPGMDVVIYQ